MNCCGGLVIPTLYTIHSVIFSYSKLSNFTKVDHKDLRKTSWQWSAIWIWEQRMAQDSREMKNHAKQSLIPSAFSLRPYYEGHPRRMRPQADSPQSTAVPSLDCHVLSPDYNVPSPDHDARQRFQLEKDLLSGTVPDSKYKRRFQLVWIHVTLWASPLNTDLVFFLKLRTIARSCCWYLIWAIRFFSLAQGNRS